MDKELVGGPTHRLPARGSLSVWRPVVKGVPQGLLWDQNYLTCLSGTWTVGLSGHSATLWMIPN